MEKATTSDAKGLVAALTESRSPRPSLARDPNQQQTSSAMYCNPSARAWKSQYSIDPAVLPFHESLPDYGQTPLRTLPHFLSERLGVGTVFLKDESRRFGLPAYKILGASWACYRALIKHLHLPLTTPLSSIKAEAETRDVNVYTATDGNWGRAVARTATMLGVKAYIYVPRVMMESTKQKIWGEGAIVTVVDGDYDLAVKEAERASIEKDGLLVEDTAWPGYEEIPQWVVDGYSTMMVEIDHQTQEQVGKAPDLIVVPIGVGSLGQAVVTHFKSKTPSAAVLAVEPDTAACLKTSLENGRMTSIATGNTTMCGMNCGTVSTLAWPVLRDGVDASITVTDAEAKCAQDILTEMQINVGPCAAATLAAFIKACGDKNEGNLHLNGISVIVLLGTEGPRGEAFYMS